MADLPLSAPLPGGSVGRRGIGWWGVMTLIATEGALFAYLLFSYYYFDFQLPPSWRLEAHPSLSLSGPNTVVLLLSSVAAWWGEKGAREARRGQALVGLFLAFALGIVFLGVQSFEWASKHFTLRDGPYASLFFTITGFHMAHVIVGVIAIALAWLWTALGYFDRVRHAPAPIVTLYWHFVDAVWICVFTTFYLTPYLW